MPTLEPPTREVLNLITKEKADFIEEQAEKMYDFVLESREILTKEAHTTLQWLFAIVIGASGYLVTLFAKTYDARPLDLSTIWWVVVPLTTAAGWAALEAFQLIKRALRATAIFPKGNSAANLTQDGFAALEEHQIRFLAAWGMQSRVDEALNQNKATGHAINAARVAVIRIPVIALIMLLTLFLLTWSGAQWWYALIITSVALAVWRWAVRVWRRRAAVA